MLFSVVKVCKTANYQVKSTQHGKLLFLETKHEGQVKTFKFLLSISVSFLACRVQGGTEFRIAYLPEIILKFMLDRAFPGAAAAVSGDAAGAAAAWSEAAAAAY